MKKYILPALAIFFLSCGGEEETMNEDVNSEEVSVDTATVDSVIVDEPEEELLEWGLEDYAQYSTRSMLYDSFDKEHLTDQTAWVAEGTIETQITYLTDPKNDWVIMFSWSTEDNESLEFVEAQYQPLYIEAYDNEVFTKAGLKTGMSLEELVEWNNGEPVPFAGFGWDGSGGVFAGSESKIGKSKINIGLGMADAGWETHNALIGDIQLSSDEDRVQGAPISVGSLTYYLTN